MRPGPGCAAAAVAVVVPVVLLASCTPGGDRAATPAPSASAPASASASTSSAPTAPTATAPAVPPAPKAGACYLLRFDELVQPTSSRKPVSCHARHNAATIYVGRLDTVVDGHAVAVDSHVVQQQMARACPAKLSAFLGGTPTVRHLSRFEVVWFNPTLAQSDLGARWFRCDVIAFAANRSLFPLPPTRRLRSVLARPGAPGGYGLCGTAAPGARGFERVICARKHSWRATSTIRLAGGDAYPGRRVVRRAGNGTCRDRVRRSHRFALRFEYGWEWPTRAQWEGGQHFGYCWEPS